MPGVSSGGTSKASERKVRENGVRVPMTSKRWLELINNNKEVMLWQIVLTAVCASNKSHPAATNSCVSAAEVASCSEAGYYSGGAWDVDAVKAKVISVRWSIVAAHTLEKRRKYF